MLNKSEKLIIVGKSGSGKNYLLDLLEKEGLLPSIKVTTRPKRQSEIDGVTYYFKPLDEFEFLLESQKFIVNQEFYNDKNELWRYGILKEDFNKSQIFIMTPGEIEQMDMETRKKCFIVYLDIDKKVREDRLLKREDNNDSIIRRIEADEIDFLGFNNYDMRITDPLFETDTILSLMS